MVLTTHPHVVPRLKKQQSCTSTLLTPSTSFHGLLEQVNFTVTQHNICLLFIYSTNFSKKHERKLLLGNSNMLWEACTTVQLCKLRVQATCFVLYLLLCYSLQLHHHFLARRTHLAEHRWHTESG